MRPFSGQIMYPVYHLRYTFEDMASTSLPADNLSALATCVKVGNVALQSKAMKETEKNTPITRAVRVAVQYPFAQIGDEVSNMNFCK